MKSLSLLGLSAALALAAPTAAADGKAECLNAAGDGQTLRDSHKLLEARDKFRMCAAAGCPSVVQGDCATWLDVVEKALPTVVLTAKSGAGAPLVDVKVSLDGKTFATTLDGEALPINPGSHTFHFEAADGSTHDELVVVSEGLKAQSVAVVLAGKAPAPPPAATAPAATATGAPESPHATADSEKGGPSGTLRTLGWVLGGAGVVGLGVGTVFGIMTLGDKSSAHCDANNVCDPGTTSGIKNASLASDVGWIAGGVLLASGAALVLFTPSRPGVTGGARVRVAPVVTASGGELVIGGSW